MLDNCSFVGGGRNWREGRNKVFCTLPLHLTSGQVSPAINYKVCLAKIQPVQTPFSNSTLLPIAQFQNVFTLRYVCLLVFYRAVPCLRWLAIVLSPRRPVINLTPVRIRFVMEKLAMGKVLLRISRVFSCLYNSSTTRTHTSFIYHLHRIILPTGSVVKQNTSLFLYVTHHGPLPASRKLLRRNMVRRLRTANANTRHATRFWATDTHVHTSHLRNHTLTP